MEARLAKIEAQQERMLTLLQGLADRVEDQIDQSDAWRANVDRTLRGDGNGYRGLLVRLDRLEQDAERKKWLLRTIGGAVVTLIVVTMWALISV